MTTVIRYDRVGVLDADRVERTPQGGIRAPARFTRVGVLDYQQPDGTIRREYRPPEEVFKPESLKTLVDAPVTHLHPNEGRVDATNFSRLSKGHVSTDVAPEDEKFVGGTVVVQDADIVSLVDQKALSEFSAGYGCTIDATPGTTPDGEPYDVVQRNIKYNHVALLPRGQGRAGSEVSLRLDSNGHQVMPLPTKDTKMDLTPEELAALKTLAAAAPKLIAMAEAGAPAAAPVLDSPAPAPAPEASAPPAAAPAAEPEKKLDSKEEAPKGPTPEEQERFVMDSIEIRDKAREVLGKEYSFAGKSNREVMGDVILRVDSKFDVKSKSDEAVRAVFDVMLARHAERADSKSELEKVQIATRQDSGEPKKQGLVQDWLKTNLTAASRK